jgi:hypothetical protein
MLPGILGAGIIEELAGCSGPRLAMRRLSGIRTHGTVTRTTVFDFYDSHDGLCRCVAKRVLSFDIFIASILSCDAWYRTVMHSWFAIWFANADTSSRSLLEFLVPSAFVLALTAQEANAASLSPAVVAFTESGAESSIVQGTHGCHYSCECGPLKDFGCEQVYHRHLHMLCLPVRCRGKACDRRSPEGMCRHIDPP